MNFTYHAKDRFAERFPDCPLSLEQAYDKSIPFGVETPTTIARLHPDYKIVFIVQKNNSERYVKTVLTEDLYYANSQMLGGYYSCKFNTTPIQPKPLTPAELWALNRKETEQKNAHAAIIALKLKEGQKRQEEEDCKQKAHLFAKEKNYITWQTDFYDEIKTRFGFSKKKINNMFLPHYNKLIAEYQAFN